MVAAAAAKANTESHFSFPSQWSGGQETSFTCSPISRYIAAVCRVFLVRPSAGPLSHLNQADREQQRFPRGVSDGTEAVALLSVGGGRFVPSLPRLLEVLSGPE